MHYNYIFRLEEEDLWWLTFVNEFGLERTIAELHEEGVEFFTPATAADTTTISQKEREIIGREPWKGERPKTFYQLDSASL